MDVGRVILFAFPFFFAFEQFSFVYTCISNLSFYFAWFDETLENFTTQSSLIHVLSNSFNIFYILLFYNLTLFQKLLCYFHEI